MKILTAEDFLNMPTTQLLGWWVYDQMNLHDPIRLEHIERTQTIDNLDKVLSSYEILGREAVASILGEVGFRWEPPCEMKVISLAKAKELLIKMVCNKDYRIFHIEFVKRTTSEYRKMRCRFGVKRDLKGVGKSFDDKDYELKTVWDMDAPPNLNAFEKAILEKYPGQPNISKTDDVGEFKFWQDTFLKVSKKGAYRSIALENIVRMTLHGTKYIIEDNKDLVHLIKD